MKNKVLVILLFAISLIGVLVGIYSLITIIDGSYVTRALWTKGSLTVVLIISLLVAVICTVIALSKILKNKNE